MTNELWNISINFCECENIPMSTWIDSSFFFAKNIYKIIDKLNFR